MTQSLADYEFAQALSETGAGAAAPLERVQMLVDIATRLTQRPKSPLELRKAISLYDEALALCPASEGLLRARVRARKGAALTAIPEAGPESLLGARAELEAALEHLRELGEPEEAAHAELNLGLVIQSLAGLHQAGIGDAIAAYHRAERVFSRTAHPTEFAIIHNNLATAYLAIPLADERAKMREALAVQSFREALGVVTLIDRPVEYAMLQNNLGNALQHAASGHPVENNLRALEAYGEALKVRTRERAPLEYANTIANKANCLRNLPDDPDRPEAGNGARLLESKRLYGEAFALFEEFGDAEKAEIVSDAISEVERALAILHRRLPALASDFGAPRFE